MKNVDIFHEIDKKGYMSGCLSKPLTFFFAWKHIFIFLMICSMDISNVIYLFFFKFIDTIFFYSTLKSNYSYRLYCPKRVAILKKKNEKIYKNLCLRYSKIFIYHIILKIIKKKNYMLFFWATLMTRRSEKKKTFLGTSEGGNSYRENF